MISLENKVIVITGGNGLLGLEMVKEVVSAGGTVVCADISKKESSDVDQFIGDLTQPEQVDALIDYVLEKYGKIDGWVNNAYPRTADWGAHLPEIPYESWRKNVDMHMNSYFLCCQRVLEKMKEKGSGSVVNLSSIYGILGADFSLYEGTSMTMPAAYSAIKGGIVNLTRYLTSYYAKSGLKINSISPGGIFDGQPESFVTAYNKKCPEGRMGNREEIAKAAVYLLSDYSSYINGHNLIVDGGWSII